MCFYSANYSTKICQFWKIFSNFSISENLKKDHIGELLSKAKKKKKKFSYFFFFSSCLHACFFANEDIVHHMVSCNSSSKQMTKELTKC